MLPYSENIDDLVTQLEEDEIEQTKTFAIKSLPTSNQFTELTWDSLIGGMIDDVSALKQSIYLLLSIEADKFIIYPYTYGIQTLDLIGKPSYYVVALLPERIKSALMNDNRIVDVSDFEFEINKNKIRVQFVVNTIYGSMNEETVVVY